VLGQWKLSASGLRESGKEQPEDSAQAVLPHSSQKTAEQATSLAVYSSALAYELISQFKLISSNCGVVHSMIPSLVAFR